jgi:hypothetical protein
MKAFRLRQREAASGWYGETIASLPLFTRLQTYRRAALSDVMGQHRTHATQQIAGLFNHLVGGGEHRGRHVEPECLCGFEIDHKLKCRRLLDRQGAGVRALEDPVHK